MRRALAPLALFAAIALSLLLRGRGHGPAAVARPADLRTIDHRESAYTPVTWTASESANAFEMRFFRPIGAAALRPGWAELAALGQRDARLRHLVPRQRDAAPALDPGTLPASGYFAGFLLGPLLDDRLAARGDPLAAPVRALVVGLGSGAGIALLAHHLPEASIVVVDVDEVVVQSVRDNFPLLRWLEGQRTSAGEPRLRLVVADARRFIQRRGSSEPPFDLIVLDAFTAGATVPPHLATREFFAECARAPEPGGTLLANVIGALGEGQPGRVRGEHFHLLRGIARSLREAGLPHLRAFPFLRLDEWLEPFDRPDRLVSRNHLLVASRVPIDPLQGRAGWERLRRFTPYAELPLDEWRAAQVYLTEAHFLDPLSALVGAAAVDAALPALDQALRPYEGQGEGWPRFVRAGFSDDPSLLAQARALVLARLRERALPPLGWDAPAAGWLWRSEVDPVAFAREHFRLAVAAASDEAYGGDAITAAPDAPLFTDQRPNADLLD